MTDHGDHGREQERQDELVDTTETAADDFRLWPPSPKTQIILIAIAFGLFNAILLAIFVYVMIKRF